MNALCQSAGNFACRSGVPIARRLTRWRLKSALGLAARATLAAGTMPAPTLSSTTHPMASRGFGEIEHASQHPEHIAAALAVLRRTLPAAAAE